MAMLTEWMMLDKLRRRRGDLLTGIDTHFDIHEPFLVTFEPTDAFVNPESPS